MDWEDAKNGLMHITSFVYSHTPKVLTFNELSEYQVLWLEKQIDVCSFEIKPVLFSEIIGDINSELHCHIMLVQSDGKYVEGIPKFLYGRTWRCWTDKPSSEQLRNSPMVDKY